VSSFCIKINYQFSQFVLLILADFYPKPGCRFRFSFVSGKVSDLFLNEQKHKVVSPGLSPLPTPTITSTQAITTTIDTNESIEIVHNDVKAEGDGDDDIPLQQLEKESKEAKENVPNEQSEPEPIPNVNSKRNTISIDSNKDITSQSQSLFKT